MAGHSGPLWAVAVSGGGDSLALMHLLRAFAGARGLAPPVVLTVDHGLRKASASECPAGGGLGQAGGACGACPDLAGR